MPDKPVLQVSDKILPKRVWASGDVSVSFRHAVAHYSNEFGFDLAESMVQLALGVHPAQEDIAEENKVEYLKSIQGAVNDLAKYTIPRLRAEYKQVRKTTRVIVEDNRRGPRSNRRHNVPPP